MSKQGLIIIANAWAEYLPTMASLPTGPGQEHGCVAECSNHLHRGLVKLDNYKKSGCLKEHAQVWLRFQRILAVGMSCVVWAEALL